MFTQQLLLSALTAFTLFGAEAAAAQPQKYEEQVSVKDKLLYPSFAEAIEQRGGDKVWQSFDTKTEDGYRLTLFRITPESELTPVEPVRPQVNEKETITKENTVQEQQQSKGPLLLIPDFSEDAYAWTNKVTESEQLSIAAQLAEEGFEVYFGNVRGSRFNREHFFLDPERNQAEFFDFDNQDIAEKDIPAMVKLIMEISQTSDKVTLVGQGIGAQQVALSLSKSAYAQDYVSQVVLTEPCLLCAEVPVMDMDLTIEDYISLSEALKVLDISSVFGPSWESDKQLLKLMLGADDTIAQALDAFEIRTEETPNGVAEISVKQAE